jgi:hypothetical protein
MNVLKGLLADKRVRAALIALALAVAGYFGVGCASFGQLRPDVAARLEVYACQVEALSEILPEGAAEDLAMAGRVGNAEYVVRQLLSFGLNEQEIQKAAEAYHACKPPELPAVVMPDPLTRT